MGGQLDLPGSSLGALEMTTHKGKCFCGAVDWQFEGDPFCQDICHCSDCREWGGALVSHTVGWQEDKFRQLCGDVAKFSKTGTLERFWCKACGGHCWMRLGQHKLVFSLPGNMPTVPFKPPMHIFCKEARVPLPDDGLAKFKDLPKEFGGTGETV